VAHPVPARSRSTACSTTSISSASTPATPESAASRVSLTARRDPRVAVMPKHLLPSSALGMAVTPHAKSLVAMKDRVEVVHAFSPSATRRHAFRGEIPVSRWRTISMRSSPTSPSTASKSSPRRTRISIWCGKLRRGRQAYPAGEAARDHDRALARTCRERGASRRHARGHVAASLSSGPR